MAFLSKSTSPLSHASLRYWLLFLYSNVGTHRQFFSQIRSKQFPGAVTSLASINKRLVLIGCDDGTIFEMDILTFDSTMLSTCHTGAIRDVAFPK